MQTDLSPRPSAIVETFEETTEETMSGELDAHVSPTHWYAAYTSSHHEKRVVSHFAERKIESFLPLYACLRRWRNRCSVSLELPLFPNYVFVRMAARERVRVLEVPGVLSLVGFGKILAPLPDFEIEALRAGLGRRKVEPYPYLVIGERVRIKAGAMMGLEGVLVRKKHNFRVVLALDTIMKCVAVEVDAGDLEPIAKPAGCVALSPVLSRPPQPNLTSLICECL